MKDLQSKQFEIKIPPIKPGQETLVRSLMIQVYGADEILTEESIERINIIKMQMMIARLNETVRELTGLTQPAPDAAQKG